MSVEIHVSDLIQLDRCLWEIPVSTRPDMRVPARIYASEALIEDFMQDRTVSQIMNVSTLPGIEKAAIVMPDGHEGYGFPIGGVAAFDINEGVVSPGGIGYDINCGVRLMFTPEKYENIRNKIPELTHEMTRMVPRGMGRGGPIKLSTDQINQVLMRGVEWAVEQGYAFEEDRIRMESNGKLPDADASFVSEQAKKRGHDQLGTLGAGNHFVEIGRVEQIFHTDAARAFGLFEDQVVIMIHTGSRGLGHQVATDYLRMFVKKLPEYGLNLPDRELACAPINSEDGVRYLKAMAAAANFAFCNRQVISWEVRKAWENVMKSPGDQVELLYDVAHNIAKRERHRVNSEEKELIVHRKGATRAFGPGHPEIPERYRKAGQPVLIPGSMGTGSFVLAGAESGMNQAFGSTCHGAGRKMSRRAAKREVDAQKLKKELASMGISVEAGSFAGLAEEAPAAYKDVELVVDTVHEAGLASKVALLRPAGVIKG